MKKLIFNVLLISCIFCFSGCGIINIEINEKENGPIVNNENIDIEKDFNVVEEDISTIVIQEESIKETIVDEVIIEEDINEQYDDSFKVEEYIEEIVKDEILDEKISLEEEIIDEVGDEDVFYGEDIEDIKDGYCIRFLTLNFRDGIEFNTEMHEFLTRDIANVFNQFENLHFMGYGPGNNMIEVYIKVFNPTSSKNATDEANKGASIVVPLWNEKYN